MTMIRFGPVWRQYGLLKWVCSSWSLELQLVSPDPLSSSSSSPLPFSLVPPFHLLPLFLLLLFHQHPCPYFIFHLFYFSTSYFCFTFFSFLLISNQTIVCNFVLSISSFPLSDIFMSSKCYLFINFSEEFTYLMAMSLIPPPRGQKCRWIAVLHYTVGLTGGKK